MLILKSFARFLMVLSGALNLKLHKDFDFNQKIYVDGSHSALFLIAYNKTWVL